MAVYFFQAGPGGPIKIGSSRQIEPRLRLLQNHHWAEIVELAVGPGCHQVETALHKRFADVRIRGEWFWPSAELLAFIKEVAAGAVPYILAGLPKGPVQCNALGCHECPYSLHLLAERRPFKSWRATSPAAAEIRALHEKREREAAEKFKARSLADRVREHPTPDLPRST